MKFKRKTLLFITNIYPFGRGETFVETEIAYLAPHFEKVIIVSRNQHDPITREIPSNAVAVRYPAADDLYLKISALRGLFSGTLREEIHYVKNRLNLTWDLEKLKVFLVSLEKARRFHRYLLKLIQEQNIDPEHLIIANYWLVDYTLAVAMLKQQFPAIFAYSRAHGWDLYFERSAAGYLPFRYQLFHHLDALYFISRNGLDYFFNRLQLSPGDRNKLHLSRLGIVNPEAGYKEKLNEELHLVSVAMIYPNKRVDLLIRALAMLEGIRVKWVHFGAGYDKKDEEHIRSLADDLLAGKPEIEYRIAGFTPNQEIMDYYRRENVDLLVNLSESEGIPVSFMECMSFGIPVMATRVGGVPEIIDDDSGIFLPPNPTAAEVASALQHFHALPAEKKVSMRKNAYQRWAERYDANRNFQQMTDHLHRLYTSFKKQ